jgi:hypothetical protein
MHLPPNLSSELECLSEKLNRTLFRATLTTPRFNAFAREGRDPDFQQGESSCDVRRGLNYFPDHKTPTLEPIEEPPFYWVEIHMGTVGNLGDWIPIQCSGNRHPE